MHILTTKKLKVKFTRASAKDNSLITVNLRHLTDEVKRSYGVDISDWLDDLSKGSRLIIELSYGRTAIPLLFTVNRTGASLTATTKSWPFYGHDLCYTPSVGRPVEVDVVSLEIVQTTTTVID